MSRKTETDTNETKERKRKKDRTFEWVERLKLIQMKQKNERERKTDRNKYRRKDIGCCLDMEGSHEWSKLEPKHFGPPPTTPKFPLEFNA